MGSLYDGRSPRYAAPMPSATWPYEPLFDPHQRPDTSRVPPAAVRVPLVMDSGDARQSSRQLLAIASDARALGHVWSTMVTHGVSEGRPHGRDRRRPAAVEARRVARGAAGAAEGGTEGNERPRRVAHTQRKFLVECFVFRDASNETA